MCIDRQHHNTDETQTKWQYKGMQGHMNACQIQSVYKTINVMPGIHGINQNYFDTSKPKERIISEIQTTKPVPFSKRNLCETEPVNGNTKVSIVIGLVGNFTAL